MRVGVHTWFQSLIILPLLFFSADSDAYQIWSKLGGFFDPKSYNADNAKKGGYDFSQCKLTPATVSGMEEDGKRDSKKEFVQTFVEEDYILTRYGEDVGAFGLSALWNYATRLKFNAPQKYRKPILSALRNALANGNCDLANYFANMLINGKEKQTPDGKNGFIYEDDHENGTSCVVPENGEAQCRRHYLTEDNPDGTKRICITPDGQSGCHEDFSMEELSKKNNKKDDKSNNSGSGDGKGNGSHNKEGGLDGSDNGTGSGDSGNGSGNGQGGKGDGSGDGSGKGKGGGVGDKEGDGDKDKTEDVEIKAAPSMKEVFSGLRDKIKDKLLKDFEISNAQCPTVQFPLLNRTFTIDNHCNILESIREFMQSLMMFLYTFAAIRVVLSA